LLHPLSPSSLPYERKAGMGHEGNGVWNLKLFSASPLPTLARSSFGWSYAR
jgi:hypothetical protein